MINRKFKIYFVTEDFYPDFIGGQGIYGFELVSNLASQGCEITVLAEDKKGRKNFWYGKKNINLVLVPFCFGNQLILSLLEYLMFILRCSNQYFDLVHANQLSGLFFVLFKPKNIGKVVVSVHNTNYDMAQKTDSPLKWFLYQPLIWLERLVYKRADGLLFNSPSEQLDLINYYQIADKSTKAVYLGVDKSNFTSRERQQAQVKIRQDLGTSQDTKIILYVGRLVKRKKVDTIIMAVKRLDNAVAVIIGQGPEREALQKISTPNVKFLGFIEDTRSYFLAADLFVTVSVAEGGFLLTALEAASFGLPLILSSSAAGFPILKEGINGFIVEPDNYKNLAAKIELVLRKSDQMGKKSREFAKRFSWVRCAKETLKFYQSLA